MIDNEFIHINEVVVVKNLRGESSYFCPHFKMQTSCECGMNSPNHVLFNAADTHFTYVSKNVPHCDGWMTELRSKINFDSHPFVTCPHIVGTGGIREEKVK